jgi:hypothetical protein
MTGMQFLHASNTSIGNPLILIDNSNFFPGRKVCIFWNFYVRTNEFACFSAMPPMIS